MPNQQTGTSVIAEEDYLRLAAEAAASASEKGPVPVDPDVADWMGAFEEDAMTEEDALDSLFDGLDPTDDEEEADHG